MVRTRVACGNLTNWILLFLFLISTTVAIIYVITQIILGEDGRSTFHFKTGLYSLDDAALFDNTFLTWSTDLAISATTGSFAYFMSTYDTNLAKLSCQFMFIYSASTALAGILHYLHPSYDTSFQQQENPLNTKSFRWYWCVVVTLTSITASAQGRIANAILKPSTFWRVPDAFWNMHGLCTILFYAVSTYLGYFSCHRPAADIFIAGTSQCLCTFYLHYALYMNRKVWHTKQMFYVWMLAISLTTMAPALFLFPSLVVQTALSMGEINVFLHTMIFMSWGLQGYSLYKIIEIEDQTR